MGYQRDLLEGVAAWLAGVGVGVWHPAGIYQPADTGIVLRTIPAAPENVIVLSTYPVSDDPSLSDSVTGLQIVTRAAGQDPRPTDDLTDSVFNHLHAATAIDLSTGIRVVQCLHQSGASLGQDQNNRWRTSSNYYLNTHRPSLNRI